MNAVITADIIDYTKLSVGDQDSIMQSVYNTLENLSEVRTNAEENKLSITRGDSIQIEMERIEDALWLSLLLKAAIKKTITKKKYKPEADIRIAVGLGEISGKRGNVNESTGEAYTYSGRTLDKMKKQKRTLAIITNDPSVNAELDTELRLLEVILSGWTVQSAEVIYWTLLGYNENEIAGKLGKSQSAINQRKKTAGWAGIEPLLNRYRSLFLK